MHSVNNYADETARHVHVRASACKSRPGPTQQLLFMYLQDPGVHNRLKQVALLWQRDRATRLSVEILQLQNIPFES